VRLRLLLWDCLLLLLLLLSLQERQGVRGKPLASQCNLLLQILWEPVRVLLLSWAVTHG
jgi:hypothetical protein